ncbi:MAG: flippase [Deltaproteobacteria bacterium]|nr:flippase [Deltaproteobacteria bacterium]
MSKVQTIIKNASSLAVGRVATKAMSLVFLGFVARKLGEEGFGRFSTAMALVGFVEILPGYIARPFIIRHVAREMEKSGRFLAGVIGTNVALSIALFIALYFVTPLLNYPPDTDAAVLLLAASLLFSSITNSYHAVFTGFERMERSAMLDVANSLMTIAAGVAALLLGGDVVALAGCYAAARVGTWWLARRWALAMLDKETGARPDWALVRELAVGAWPFFITQLFIIFYNRADIIMLSVMDGPIPQDVAVGHYNAAYKLMEALGLLTSSFVVAIYPLLARQFMEGTHGVRATFQAGMRFLFALVLPVAVGTTLLADDLMGLLFGDHFRVAGAALAVLIWGQVLDSVNPLAAVTLRAIDKERDLARITGACAVFNVALNVILIPRYSYMGAAWATLLSFVLVYVWGIAVLRRDLGPLSINGSALRASLAAAAMGGVVHLTHPYGYGWAIVAGAAAYPPLALAFGVVRREDWTMIQRRRAAGGTT